MNRLKTISLLISIFLLTACNMSFINGGPSFDQFHAASEHIRVLDEKQMPQHFVVDPLANINLEANAGILIHATTGDILFEKNIDESLAIASMSKVMTELLVLEAIEAGTLHWDEDVAISDYAYQISNTPGYASVLLQQDKTYKVSDLFQAMAIRSANGATIALAEAVAGSEQAFVERMNERAAQLQLNDTVFVNSTGLTNSDLFDFHSVGKIDDNNLMSAKDLAFLSRYIVNNQPDLLEITKMSEFVFDDVTFTNSNWMLPDLQQTWIDEDVTFQGVDGLKTGFTKDAGYGFVGTMKTDNRRFISVIIGTEEVENRFIETKVLYEELTTQLNP